MARISALLLCLVWLSAPLVRLVNSWTPGRLPQSLHQHPTRLSTRTTEFPWSTTTTTTQVFLAQQGGDDSRIHSGTVKWFNTLKGYGFIVPDEDGMQDVFVHQSDIVADGFRSLADGEAVEYQLRMDEAKNRYKAAKVTGPGGGRVQGGDPNSFRPMNNF
ncbi:hypothetical protein ACA910_003892 [Epithemia clementina (nom. ined.)]